MFFHRHKQLFRTLYIYELAFEYGAYVQVNLVFLQLVAELHLFLIYLVYLSIQFAKRTSQIIEQNIVFEVFFLRILQRLGQILLICAVFRNYNDQLFFFDNCVLLSQADHSVPSK